MTLHVVATMGLWIFQKELIVLETSCWMELCNRCWTRDTSEGCSTPALEVWSWNPLRCSGICLLNVLCRKLHETAKVTEVVRPGNGWKAIAEKGLQTQALSLPTFNNLVLIVTTKSIAPIWDVECCGNRQWQRGGHLCLLLRVFHCSRVPTKKDV